MNNLIKVVGGLVVGLGVGYITAKNKFQNSNREELEKVTKDYQDKIKKNNKVKDDNIFKDLSSMTQDDCRQGIEDIMYEWFSMTDPDCVVDSVHETLAAVAAVFEESTGDGLEYVEEEPEEASQDPETPSEEDQDKYKEIIRKLNYNEYSTKKKTSDKLINKVVPEEKLKGKDLTDAIMSGGQSVYGKNELISESEFIKQGDDYDKESLSYYPLDNAIADSDDEEVVDGVSMIGSHILGAFKKPSVDKIFVRCHAKGTDYEIFIERGKSFEHYLRGDYETKSCY